MKENSYDTVTIGFVGHCPIVSLSEVKSVIERAQLKRDVIDVEPFGLLEYALICKLGTNAAGLVSKLSWRLKNARFSVFSAKLVNNFLKT